MGAWDADTFELKSSLLIDLGQLRVVLIIEEDSLQLETLSTYKILA